MLSTVNTIIAISTVLIGLWSIDVLILRTKLGAKFPWYQNFIEKNELLIGTAVSWGGVLGSLFYSDIIGYEPCPLCWWIRIFRYSSALIMIIALYHRDYSVFRYIKALSLVGALFGLYMLLMAWFPGAGLTCSATELCLREYVKVWGFVTIPFMSFMTSVFLFSLSLFATRKNR